MKLYLLKKEKGVVRVGLVKEIESSGKKRRQEKL